MNPLVASKKVLLFGLFGAVGCLAGWLLGEPCLAIFDAVANSAGAGQAPTLISRPTAPSADAPPLPDDFRRRVEAAGGSSGDVQIKVIWDDTNDLDLHCVDPSGFEIWYKQKLSPTRGQLDVDRNAGCQSTVPKPVENIFWPKDGAPQGDYTVYVNFFQRCSSGPDRSDFRVNVLANGKREDISDFVTKTPGGDPGPKKKVFSFKVEPRLELYVPADFEISQGKRVKVPVTVRRAYFTGSVEVNTENLPEGVLAGKLTIPEGKEDGELELKAADDAKEVTRTIQFRASGGGLSKTKDSKLTVPKPAVQFSLVMMLAIGFWTALLSVGLCLALLAGQNKYLGKPLFAPGRIPLAMVILGAVAAGFVSGTIGQALYYVFLAIGVAKLGFLIGWLILGVLLGWGVSFFIPNLDSKKAALAGLGGGFLGAIAFWALSSAMEWFGRFGGAAILGFCIGLMVAVVEVAFRRAWLEVRFSEREVIAVNLGPEPVKVGGDARSCTVWARGAPEVALRYFIRDGQVICNDVPGRTETPVTDGDTRVAGGVTVVVRTGSTPLPEGSAPPPLPPRPASPPRPTTAPPPVPTATAPPAKPPAAPAPVAAKPTQPDYDDGMPMPMGPPPPARTGATSILDIDDLLAAAPSRPAAPPAPAAKPAATPAPPAPAPPTPAAAKSMAPPVPKPPVPAVAKSMAPPAPPAPAAKSIAPPTPKPPAAGGTPAAGPKPGDPDACPSCGRKAPGKPGSRYCVVCDKTF